MKLMKVVVQEISLMSDSSDYHQVNCPAFVQSNVSQVNLQNQTKPLFRLDCFTWGDGVMPLLPEYLWDFCSI